MSITGWHPGERSIQQKLGWADKVVTSWTAIQGDLPPEHAQFYETCLPFIPVTTLDREGRPWGSILSGKNGSKGFVRQRQYTKLDVQAETWEGDPLTGNLQQFEQDEKFLIAGIGVEFPTRRRNKFAGTVFNIKRSGHDINLQLLVDEAIGNCPKYINVRNLEPRTERNANVIYDRKSLSTEDQLPQDVVDFVLTRDTVFLGTSYVPAPDDVTRFNPHVGMNHRGGLPGFVRVRKDKRTLVLPDYSGNSMMTSLGNIECTPLASLTFVDFVTGDVLYLTGTATNVVGTDTHTIMPFQNALTLIHTTGYVFVRDALPVRQKEGTENRASPYSPPVRLLAEEASMNLFNNDDRPDATLARIDIHALNVMTFTWESSKDLEILPGQAIILDCSSFLGTRQYQHMAPMNPISVNDDRIRTWTVSSASSGPRPARRFSITLRHKVGGALTTAFFTIAQKLQQMKHELLTDARPLNLTVKIAGITGIFTLPPTPPSLATSPPSTTQGRNLIWFAGGIGITPFLSMLDSLRQTVPSTEHVKIHLFLSTRDAHTLLPLLIARFEGTFGHAPQTSGWKSKPNLNVSLAVDVLYSRYDPADGIYLPTDAMETGTFVFRQFDRRLDVEFIEERKDVIVGGHGVYVCGPEDYTRMIVETVKRLGVQSERVHSEGFLY
ncbi:hypothetical protein AN958_11857 [Leucoagaricus sp. SymC.cos]|nr:hypothetical protein AN958_11857 [Leucoagaricus sp. SymC.cos]